MRPTLVMLFAAGMVGIAACSGSYEAAHDQPGPAAVPARKTAAVMNVPSLLGLSLDDLTKRVGPRLPIPAGFNDPTLNSGVASPDSTTLFRYRNLAMVVSYDNRSRQVNDLLLLGSDETALMGLAQLELGAPAYLVLPVFQGKHPTQLLGLRVLRTGLSQ